MQNLKGKSQRAMAKEFVNEGAGVFQNNLGGLGE